MRLLNPYGGNPRELASAEALRERLSAAETDSANITKKLQEM